MGKTRSRKKKKAVMTTSPGLMSPHRRDKSSIRAIRARIRARERAKARAKARVKENSTGSENVVPDRFSQVMVNRIATIAKACSPSEFIMFSSNFKMFYVFCVFALVLG